MSLTRDEWWAVIWFSVFFIVAAGVVVGQLAVVIEAGLPIL